jgi:hypothetical protein
MRSTFACGFLGTCESLLVFRAAVNGEASFVLWIAEVDRYFFSGTPLIHCAAPATLRFPCFAAVQPVHTCTGVRRRAAHPAARKPRAAVSGRPFDVYVHWAALSVPPKPSATIHGCPPNACVGPRVFNAPENKCGDPLAVRDTKVDARYCVMAGKLPAYG